MIESENCFFKYYDILKNDIDIHAEKLILSTENNLNLINTYRSKFLNKIQKIINPIVEKTNYQSKNIFNQNYKFVFFIPRTNLEINLKIFQSNIFGFLIIVNQTIDENVIEFLKYSIQK